MDAIDERARPTMTGALATEARAMLTLALPVVASELGWMAMSLIDTIMVGRLGKEAIGVVGLGNIVLYSVVVFGIGLVLGLDTRVGAGLGEDLDRDDRPGAGLARGHRGPGRRTTTPLTVRFQSCESSSWVRRPVCVVGGVRPWVARANPSRWRGSRPRMQRGPDPTAAFSVVQRPARVTARR
jgi:hypothetical protein